MGQTATVADASWVVNSAQPATQVTDQFGVLPPKQGNYVIVDFTFTNDGNEPKHLSQPIMAFYDSQNRKSSPDTDTFGMIRVTIEVREEAVTRRAQSSVHSMEGALTGGRIKAVCHVRNPGKLHTIPRLSEIETKEKW